MLVVPILLSVFWAVCSTVLIQPWFWYNLIKRKTLIGDNDHRGWCNEEKNEYIASIIFQAVFGIITLVMSLAIYSGLLTRYNFYGSIVPILLVLIFQGINIWIGWNSKKKEKTIAIGIVACICLFVQLTDAITNEFDVIGIPKVQEEVPIVVSTINEEEKEKIFPSSTIKSLFKATRVTGPIYSHGKFIYNVGDSPNGHGIVVIDENAGETAKFIACNYSCEMTLKLRNQYPFDRIKVLDVVVDSDNVPFGEYAILRKPNMFGAPVLDRYVLQNMITGEFTEFTPQTLPEFAR